MQTLVRGFCGSCEKPQCISFKTLVEVTGKGDNPMRLDSVRHKCTECGTELTYVARAKVMIAETAK